MNVIDISLLVLLGGFVLAGFWFGIIHMIGAIVGLVLGALAAGQFYGSAAAWLAPYIGGNLNLASIIMFFAIFVLVNRLIGLLFWIIEKVFNFIAVIPFLKTFNRLLGAAVGFVEGLLVLGAVVYFASRFPITAGFAATLKNSQVAKVLYPISAILAPLLPAALRAAQSVF